ncbi:hypothetical protein SEUCBS139899_010657 [Sporothrix eucalyptigena]
MSGAGPPDDVVFVEPTYNVLICRRCHAAIRPKGSIGRHFRNVHQDKGDVLQRVMAAHEGQDYADPTDPAVHPPDGSAAVPELEAHAGFQCGQCPFRTKTRDTVVKHWRTAMHEPDGKVKVRDVVLQSWCKGQNARYWVVGDEAAEASGLPRPPGTTATGAAPAFHAPPSLAALLTAAEDACQQGIAGRLHAADTADAITRSSSLAGAAGWPELFQDKDLAAVMAAAQWLERSDSDPDQRLHAQAATAADTPADVQRMFLLADSFGRAFARCCRRIDRVPIPVRQQLRGITVRTVQMQGRYFRLPQHPSTTARYQLLGKRFLVFCYRAFRLGRAEAEAAWAVRWTDAQWEQFARLYDAVVALDTSSPVRRAPSPSLLVRDDISVASDDSFISVADSAVLPGVRGSGELETLDPLDTLDTLCIAFVVSCIKDEVGGDVYANVLLCFCAALGVQAEPVGYRMAHLYTPLLAGILWWCRVFFLEDAFADVAGGGKDVDVAKIQAFDASFATWLCAASHAPVASILRWMAYGKVIRSSELGQESLRWSADLGTLYQDGEAIEMRRFKTTLCALVDKAEAQMNELFGQQWPRVRGGLDLAAVHDTMMRRGAGGSFLTDARNGWLRPGARYLINMAHQRLWDQQRNALRPRAAEAWLQTVDRFRDSLMVAVHTWSGQPGRGPEVMTLRRCDSHSTTRNVFVVDGQVMLVTDRDKIISLRGCGRKVARFLPLAVGRLVVAFLAWVQPAELFLAQQLGRVSAAINEAPDCIWQSPTQAEPPGPERLSHQLGLVFQAGVGVRLNLRRYRPAAIEIGRHIKGIAIRRAEAEEEVEDDDDDDDADASARPRGSNSVWDLQATHSTWTARHHYGIHVGFQAALQPEMLALFKDISALWHGFLKTGFLSEKDAALQDAARSIPVEDGAGRKRARHPSVTDERLSKRQASPSPAPSSALSGVSTLCPPSPPPSYTARPALPAPPALHGAPPPVPLIGYKEVTDGLSHLFGSKGTWRSLEQEQCMRMICGLRPQETGLCVLPTGAGKSVLFFLPAVMASTGTSVVVVPFNALLHDLVARARQQAVDCLAWDATAAAASGLARTPRLVVVSADQASDPRFCAYVDMLLASGALQRLFIDECHTILTDVSYRTKLAALRSLRRFAVPLVLLTATMPPPLEPLLDEAMLLTGTRVVRVPTARANIRYRIHIVREGQAAVIESAVAEAERLAAAWTGDQRGVLYCRSYIQCGNVAAAVGCGMHHSGMTEDERVLAREAWVGGRGSRWIVATPGLGTGIDVPGLVAVVHVELPYGLIDFVQQTGRGGRRPGETVESLIVYNGKPVPTNADDDVVQQYANNALARFLDEPGCRRTTLGMCIDGVADETCTTLRGALLCDRCEAAAGTTQPARQDVFPPQQGAPWPRTPAAVFSEPCHQAAATPPSRTVHTPTPASSRRHPSALFRGSSAGRRLPESTPGTTSATGVTGGGPWSSSQASQPSPCPTSRWGVSQPTPSNGLFTPSLSSSPYRTATGTAPLSPVGSSVFNNKMPPTPSSSPWGDAQRAEGADEGYVQRAVQEGQDRCVLCLHLERKGERGRCQGSNRCLSYGGSTVRALRTSIDYARYSCCFQCKLPFNLCRKPPRACTKEDVVTPVLLLVQENDEEAVALYERLSGKRWAKDNEAMHEYHVWCGQKARVGSWTCSNGFRLWMALTVPRIREVEEAEGQSA